MFMNGSKYSRLCHFYSSHFLSLCIVMEYYLTVTVINVRIQFIQLKIHQQQLEKP